MKKMIYLLALCLCLNSFGALADGDIAEPQSTVAQAPAEAPEKPAEAPDPGDADADEPEPMKTPDPTPTPTPTPTATPAETPEATVQPTPTATGVPAEEAGDTETPAAESGATGDPEDETESTEPPADAPAAEPTPQTEPLEEPSEEPEASFRSDSGTLEELLAQVGGQGTIYLRVGAEKRAYVKEAPLKKLSGLLLEPDREVFKGDDYVVYVSKDDPKRTRTPALIDLTDYETAGADETAELYFWVDKRDRYEPTATEEPEPTPEPGPTLTVEAEGYVPGAWSAETPSFTLSGMPETGSYSYAAIVYGERIVPLSGDTYAPEAEGQYTLRFALLDAIGDIVSISETYELMIDRTPPEEVYAAADDMASFTLLVCASDSLSGVAAVSVDGGETWTELADNETYTYAAGQATTFAPGMIQVRDAAGNIWQNESEIRLEAIEPEPTEEPYHGGGGGGGGGGRGAAPRSHASGDGEEGAAYETLTLELPEEPMTQLTVGGETMALTLVLDAAQEKGAPVGQAQPFTAELRSWKPAAQSEDAHDNVLESDGAPKPDTLLLNAELDANLGDEFTYTWHFNGEVYRMLANSGVKYLALKVGDDIAAFRTEGFTGGTKYTELKMLGVSTRRFDYTLTMRVNRSPGYVSAMSDSDFSADCDLSIRTEVENMAYELSGSTRSIMYFYDVYLGPEAMLDAPFGQYKAV